jgi:hypothetical protein
MERIRSRVITLGKQQQEENSQFSPHSDGQDKNKRGQKQPDSNVLTTTTTIMINTIRA